MGKFPLRQCNAQRVIWWNRKERNNPVASGYLSVGPTFGDERGMLSCPQECDQLNSPTFCLACRFWVSTSPLCLCPLPPYIHLQAEENFWPLNLPHVASSAAIWGLVSRPSAHGWCRVMLKAPVWNGCCWAPGAGTPPSRQQCLPWGTETVLSSLLQLSCPPSCSLPTISSGVALLHSLRASWIRKVDFAEFIRF